MADEASPGLSRRNFLSTTSVGIAAASISWSAQSYAKVYGANDRLRVGFIGAGGMAGNHFNAYVERKDVENLEAVAVADCWRTRAEHGAKKIGAATVATDYRKVLDDAAVDYVTIATPEHQHARMTLDALDAGKAVYCEKPLTHTIAESNAVVKKQAETGLPLQCGIQGMSDDSYASAAEAIRKGVIGQVVQAQIEYVRRYGELGLFRQPEAKNDMRKPEDLDWNAWLGPAAKTPWDPHHYFEWRNYAAYSGGIATDLFIHRLARIMCACDLMYPRRVVGMGGIWRWPKYRDLPDSFEMIAEYPRGMTVYVLGTQCNRVGIDHLIRGYRGTLYFTAEGWVAKDKDGNVLAEHKKTGGEDVALHHANLHNHLRKGEPLKCPADFAAAASAAVVMANESWRSGQMMSWDEKTRDMVPAHEVKLNPYPET
jgi:predicted dehydrogenase